MKIVCPSCTATYEVPEAVVAAKRSVRCARCGNNWVPGNEPVAAEPAPQPVAEPAPEISPMAASPAAAPPPAAQEPVAAEAAPEPEAPQPPEPAAPPAPKPALPELAASPPLAVLVAEPAQTAPPPRPSPTQVAPPPSAKPVQVAPAPKSAVTANVKPVRQTPVIGWVASIAALIILASVGIVYRTAIMKSWPPSERAYAAVGLYHQ